MSIRLHHKHLCESVGDDANKLGPARSPCSISVSHPSVFTLQWSEGFKISSPLFFSFFFSPFHFQTSSSSSSSSSCWASGASTQLYSQISHLIEHGREKKYIRKLDAGLRPLSSLIRDRVRKSLERLSPPNKFAIRGGRGCSSSRMALWRENEAGSLTTWSPPGDLPPFPLSAGNET